MLAHVLTLTGPVRTYDPDTNAPLTTWQTIKTDIPCGYYPQSGREFVAAGAVRGSQTVRFLVAYDPTVDFGATKNRIEFQGNIYPILAALPDPTARGHVNLICETGVAEE